MPLCPRLRNLIVEEPLLFRLQLLNYALCAIILGNFGDLYAYHYPLRHLAAARLQAGQLPFWNPYIFAGIPLLANSQAALFYPLSVFFQIFHITHAFTLFAFAHLLLAGVGMHLLLRFNRLSPASSCCLALAFCLSPFMTFRLAQGIPTHLAALSYLPWCWLALQSGRSWLLAGALALQLLSGHPQFVLIHGLAMAAYAVGDRGRLKTLLVGGAWAAALSLIQAFPMAEFLSLCNRRMVPAAFMGAYSMPPKALASLVWPEYAGDPSAAISRTTPRSSSRHARRTWACCLWPWRFGL